MELSNEMKNYIQEKISPLEKFVKKIYNDKYFAGRGKPRIEAFVEIEKETLHHKKGPYFKAECQMVFPGQNIVAKSETYNIEQAVDNVRDEIRGEIKKVKEKVVARAKRGARIFKKDLRLAPEAKFFRKGRIREEGI